MTTGVNLASRGNSASKKLQGQEALSLSLRCSTLRVLGDVIARTLPYAQLPTDAPTTRISIYSSQVTWNDLLSERHILSIKILRSLPTRKSSKKAVPERTTLRAWGVPHENFQVSHPGYSRLVFILCGTVLCGAVAKIIFKCSTSLHNILSNCIFL